MKRVSLFVDFWNYQLQWNDLVGGMKQCDWPQMPAAFVREAGIQLLQAGIDEPLQLEETRVYASYDPESSKEVPLRRWLSDFLDRQPSFRVFTAERKRGTQEIRCRQCGQMFTECPNCGELLIGTREKGVDTAIVTDMLSLAWEKAYDAAVLVSSDADMVPCVERLQEKGLKVINAAWPTKGHALAKACWASFNIMPVTKKLIRKDI